MIDFDKAFDRLVGHEGGYVNNPADPGGETNWGISKRSYPHIDIKNLTKEGAKEIYRRDFWDVLGDAHPALKFQVFDFAVNSGIQTALRKLQSAVGVADDGHWGPVSARALSAMQLNDVLLRFNSRRMRFITSLSDGWWREFGRGVMNRIAGQLDYAAEDN
jgi:lysozyme family protein